MTSFTNNPHPPSKKFFFEYKLEDFYQVCRAYQAGEIPAQSHVRLGVFFSENLQLLADAKELKKIRRGAMQLVRQPKYPWFFPKYQLRYIHTLAAKVSLVIECLCYHSLKPKMQHQHS